MKQKTYSDTKPNEKGFSIENVENGKCTVLFFDNIKEQPSESDENKTIYCYDTYSINITHRENLEDNIELNYSKWLECAKKEAYDEAAKDIRLQRDLLLAETDWTQMSDTALSKEKQEQYKTYRQKLRDITKQEGFPYDVEFPTLESEE